MCVKNLPMIAIWTRTAGNRTHDLQLASSMPPGCTIWLRGHYKWLSYYAYRLHWRSVALTKYKLSPNLDFHPHNSFSLETLKRPHFVVAVDITSKRSLAAAILFYSASVSSYTHSSLSSVCSLLSLSISTTPSLFNSRLNTYFFKKNLPSYGHCFSPGPTTPRRIILSFLLSISFFVF